MRMRSIALALSAAAALAAVPASAQDREPFTGGSVAAVAGVDHSGDGPGDGETGFLYGGAVTYDLGAGKLRYGIEAEATGSTAYGCYTPLGGSTRSCTTADRDLYLGGRVGVVLSPSVMAYGKAGYTNFRSSTGIDNFSTPGSPDTLIEGNDGGWRVGAGLEYNAGKFLIRSEYRYSDYGADTRHQGTVGVGFRF